MEVQQKQKEERAAAIETTAVATYCTLLVMPGDLIMEGELVSCSTTEVAYAGEDILSLLVQTHCRWNVGSKGSSSGATMDPCAALHAVIPEQHIAAVYLTTV